MSYTQGPWHFENSTWTKSQWMELWSKETPTVIGPMHPKGGRCVVAFTFGDTDHEAEKNAHLIIQSSNSHAALVAALEKAQRMLLQTDWRDDAEAMAEIETVLAMATGQPERTEA